MERRPPADRARTGAFRLDTLTALRAVAALLVFSRHASDFLFRHPDSVFTRQGATGVSFFFILSGFVLAWSARPGDKPRSFWRRRFARIFPTYILILLVAQGTEVIRGKVTVTALVLNAFLVQSWVPDSHVYFSSDMGAWSLGCEAFFYLCFPVILPRLQAMAPARRWQLAGGAAAFELVMALATHSHSQTGGVGLWLVYVLPLTRMGEFVIGMVLALAVREGLRPRVTLGQALILALAAYALAGFVPPYMMWVAVTLVPFCLLVVAAAVWDIEGRPTRWRSPWLVRLGHWSYAFYLVHITVVTVVQHVVGPGDGLAVQVGAAVLALAVATAGAGAVHTFIERPAEAAIRGGGKKSGPHGGSGRPAGEVLPDPDGPRQSQLSPYQADLDRLNRGGGAGRVRGDGGHLGASPLAGDAVGEPASRPVRGALLQRLRFTAALGVQGTDLPGPLHGGAPPPETGPHGRHRRRPLRRQPGAARQADVDLRAGRPGPGDVPLQPAGPLRRLPRGDLAAPRPEHQLEGGRPLDRDPALVVVHYFAPHIGGMEEVAAAQAASLDRLGHPVTVLTCAHSRGLERHDRRPGFALRRVGALNFLERRFGVTFPVIGPLAVARIAREVHRARIVHVHDVFYPTSHAAVLAARLLRRPYYLTQHVAMVDHPSRLVMGVQKLVYSTVGGVALRGAAGVVVYNARVRDFVVSLGVAADRVVFNHNGIDTDLYTPLADGAARAALKARYGLPADKPVVLFVGRLVPKKGYDLVMAAADPGWTTLIVGEGAPPPQAAAPGVVLFGPAGRAQLVDLYRMSDVFVFPAVGEMFTLVMQEAMAAGLPVVTTDDPAYAEYGLDRRLIAFIARRPDAIRRAVRDILASPARAAAMGSYSRSVAVDRFSWESNYHVEYSLYAALARQAMPSGEEGVQVAANIAG